jgi:DNA-binding MarR family transcriptional regulator
MSLEAKIIEVLKTSEPMRPGEIAEKLSVDKSDVDKAIKVLKKSEEIYSPKRCYYSAK